ncbi:MAG TPA: hypothetical protein VF168_09715 [Trueperaceae bacterium]
MDESSERFVEEELPPGFWEEAQEPHPPSRGQQRQVRRQPDRPPREEVSAAPDEARLPKDDTSEPGIDEPAFEVVQALFPGRIVSIEEINEPGDEDDIAATAEAPAEDEEDS